MRSHFPRPSLPHTLFRQLFAVAAGLAMLLSGRSVDSAPPSTVPVTGLAKNRPSTFILQNARVFVSPDTLLESASIVIRDGHIVSVGRAATEMIGARVLDMTGKTVYPGLIDGYSEIETPAITTGARHWNAGIMPQRHAADSYDHSVDENNRLRTQGIVARLTVPSGGQIKGTSTLVDTRDAEPERSVLRRDVAMHMSLTTSRNRSQYPGSPMGAVALVRQTLHDANWYQAAWKAYNESDTVVDRPEQNPALAALASWLDEKSPIIVDAQNERYAMRVDRLADEFSMPNVIIRGSGREYRRLEAIVEAGHPILVPVDFPKAPKVSSPESAAEATLQELMHWDLAPENAGRLVEAGAVIALTSDGLDDKSIFLESIRKAVKRGLSPEAALAALTTNPAKLFGFEAKLGTIEAGKIASLAITDGDLFDDKTQVQETWVAGQRYRIAPKTPHIAKGKWRLRFVGLTKRPKHGTITVYGDAEKPKAKMEIRQTSYEAKKITLSDATLSVSVDAEGWRQTGVALVSFVLTPEALEQKGLTAGSLLLPDGTRSAIVATKISEETDKESEETDKEADPGQSPSEVNDASESEEDEKLAGSDADPPGEPDTGDATAGALSTDADSGDQDDASEEPTTTALYPVNYPLGAYGVEALPEVENVLFSGGTIWTCDEESNFDDPNFQGGVIENGCVLVLNGKIEAVGRTVKAPAGVRTVDLAGKHVTPGLIDCHSHIATDGGVNEGTQAITAEVRIGDFIDPDDIAIYRQLAGGVTSANILHGSANPIGGQNQVIKLRWGVDPEALKLVGAPQGIKFALGENVKQSNWGEGHRTRYPQSRMGVDEIMIDAFERARAYSEDWAHWKKAPNGIPPRVDLELAAIAEILEGTRWIHCHSYRQSEILALMRTCDAYGITIGSLQHILEGYKLADEMAARRITGSTFSDWWAYKFEVYDAIPYNGALMHQAGVVVSFNSDDAEMGRRLNTEAGKAMKYGDVPASEALKFVTLNPAKQLRIDDRVGSLSVGKDADLAIWSGPPMSNFSRCVQTWIDGRLYFDIQNDQKLRQRDRAHHAALVQRVLASGAAMKDRDDKERDTQESWPRVNEYCIHGCARHNEQEQP